MGCMRSYTTLITRDAPDVTDRPSIPFQGQKRRSILRSHHCLHHLGQPPATHGRARHDQCFNSGTLAWRSSSHCCRLRRRVSPLQITDRVLSSLMQRERVVATRLVAGISIARTFHYSQPCHRMSNPTAISEPTTWSTSRLAPLCANATTARVHWPRNVLLSFRCGHSKVRCPREGCRPMLSVARATGFRAKALLRESTSQTGMCSAMSGWTPTRYGS